MHFKFEGLTFVVIITAITFIVIIASLCIRFDFKSGFKKWPRVNCQNYLIRYSSILSDAPIHWICSSLTCVTMQRGVSVILFTSRFVLHQSQKRSCEFNHPRACAARTACQMIGVRRSLIFTNSPLQNYISCWFLKISISSDISKFSKCPTTH
jgi:hypothetical protein